MSSFINRILWFTMIVSLLIYGLVANLVVSKISRDAPDQLALLAGILGFQSLVIAVGTLVYRRCALVNPIQSGQIDINTPAGQAKAFTPFILNLTLTQSVGIFGLVLAMLSGQAEYYYPFMVGALVLMVLHRPSASALNPVRLGQGSSRRPPPIG